MPEGDGQWSLARYERIDWDDDEDGNLMHCMRVGRLGPNAERIVDEVLANDPAKLPAYPVETAEVAIVGPDLNLDMWVILFSTSHKRGDWLRPVTGWPAEVAERRSWEQRRRRA
jgi:hypothetical protein